MDTGTCTPSGRLLFHVLGAIAEFERDLIAEPGLAAARRRDRHPGKLRAALVVAVGVQLPVG